MLAVCLLLSLTLQPFVGAGGAVVATLAVRRTLATRYIDENLTLTAIGAAVMVALFRTWGVAAGASCRDTEARDSGSASTVQRAEEPTMQC